MILDIQWGFNPIFDDLPFFNIFSIGISVLNKRVKRYEKGALERAKNATILYHFV